MPSPVSGFSKKTKAEKIAWLASQYLEQDLHAIEILKSYWNQDPKLQQLHDDFIENTLTNFYLPLGIAPNFLINNKLYALPMVTEESSVVAAASNAAKFWLDRGGFQAQVISTVKNGQVHINYFGKTAELTAFFNQIKPILIESIADTQRNMQKRGGGLIDMILVDSTKDLEGYYQLHCTFETGDAMGANFINTCLESFANTLEKEATTYNAFEAANKFPEVVMSILSNYVPDCTVKASVTCKVSELAQKNISGEEFATKFVRAIQIAKTEPRRAVTHNKGAMNGIDAIVIATGNDFRAVEAGVHSYAARDGKYTSLTDACVEGDTFHFWIEIPLAVGTVGGLTRLHPMAKVAFKVLQQPDAQELMKIIAVSGLAQNFAAVRSLTTTGIQKGHMKMHLMNILNQLAASSEEKEKTISHFTNQAVTHSAVVTFVNLLRN
ncbi:MAG: hydroxymethylglutaryl-CoA reductase [Planctomycetota bacterium]|jgi:hydroxymethylglutaryl-CoA reductase|uniref:hydroxymethylglutaryl-CoA reductase, degradative n=1 Tax=Patiriisocius sp. Uisw_047 TaxID=3230969 RepID=UPI0039ED8405